MRVDFVDDDQRIEWRDGIVPIHVERHVVKSGLPELDELLGGGLSSGTSTLVTGPAGAGKSSVSMQYAVAACERGERVAVTLFDEGTATLIERMRGMGRPIEKYLANGLLSIHQVDPAEFSPGQLVNMIRDQVEEQGAKLILLDSLNGYMHSMPGENFLTVQLHELTDHHAAQDVDFGEIEHDAPRELRLHHVPNHFRQRRPSGIAILRAMHFHKEPIRSALLIETPRCCLCLGDHGRVLRLKR